MSRNYTKLHLTCAVCAALLYFIVLYLIKKRRSLVSESFLVNPFAPALLGPLPLSTILLRNATCVQKYSKASFVGDMVCIGIGDHSDGASLSVINSPGSMKTPAGIMIQAYGGSNGQAFTSVGPDSIENWNPDWAIIRFIIYSSALTAKDPNNDPLPSKDDFQDTIGGYIKSVPTKADLSDQPKLSPDWIYAPV